jgi:hypothetical protein
VRRLRNAWLEPLASARPGEYSRTPAGDRLADSDQTMKSKAIKVDWDALEDAFNNQNEELVYYLDLVTGHVHLEGEGEDDDEDDDESYDPSSHNLTPPVRDDSTRAYVHPPDTGLKVDWLKAFMEDQENLDKELVGQLRQALAESDPAPAIREALNQHPEGRDRWYLYRSVRIQQLIGGWIDNHKVTTVDTPPWAKG